jgi:hypothetical protein
MLEPNLAADLRDIELPTQAYPSTLKLLPNSPFDLNDRDDPKETCARMLSDFPK